MPPNNTTRQGHDRERGVTMPPVLKIASGIHEWLSA